MMKKVIFGSAFLLILGLNLTYNPYIESTGLGSISLQSLTGKAQLHEPNTSPISNEWGGAYGNTRYVLEINSCNVYCTVHNTTEIGIVQHCRQDPSGSTDCHWTYCFINQLE